MPNAAAPKDEVSPRSGQAPALPALRALNLITQTPTGTISTVALVNRGAAGGGAERVELPTYAIGAEARALRERRVQAGLTLRKTASAMGLTAVELSGLEGGRFACATPDEWTECLRRLDDAIAGAKGAA